MQSLSALLSIDDIRNCVLAAISDINASAITFTFSDGDISDGGAHPMAYGVNEYNAFHDVMNILVAVNTFDSQQ